MNRDQQPQPPARQRKIVAGQQRKQTDEQQQDGGEHPLRKAEGGDHGIVEKGGAADNPDRPDQAYAEIEQADDPQLDQKLHQRDVARRVIGRAGGEHHPPPFQKTRRPVKEGAARQKAEQQKKQHRAARRRKEQPRPPRQQDKRRGKQDHVNNHGGKGGMEAEQLIKGEQEADGHQDAADGIHTGIPQRLFEAPGRP